MTANNSQKAPRLAPPGAGLPLIEKWIVKYFVLPRVWRKKGWDEFQELFQKEGEKILKLAFPLSPQQLKKQVLVERIPGIEDSSRYWSVAMTLEHLIIVGNRISEAVKALTDGRVPTESNSIASVKPHETVQASQIVTDFMLFQNTFITSMKVDPAKQQSTLRYPHEWFGPLNAHQWHGLAAIHQNLHRQQIQKIVEGLERDS